MMAPSAKHSSGRKAYLNARLIDPMQNLDDKGGLLIEDGWILAAGPKVTAQSIGSGTASFDCKGLILARLLGYRRGNRKPKLTSRRRRTNLARGDRTVRVSMRALRLEGRHPMPLGGRSANDAARCCTAIARSNGLAAGAASEATRIVG